VCCYGGEYVGTSVLRKRQTPGDLNFVFVSRESIQGLDGCVKTVIDATRQGNVARFINHSCSPNLSPYPVRVGAATPCIAFFARRAIRPLEELSFDYGQEESSVAPAKGVKCSCLSADCKGFLPYQVGLSDSSSETSEDDDCSQTNKRMRQGEPGSGGD